MLFSSSSSCSREKDDKIVSCKGYLAALKDRSVLFDYEHYASRTFVSRL